ncbi:MAG: hypothetical protein RLZZ304_697, partial [Actinomycetota bacterium]
MTDEALLEALGSDRMDELGTLQSMHLLERETELRQQDQADFENWVAQMVSENSAQSRLALSTYAPHALAELAAAASEANSISPIEPSTDSQFVPSPEQLLELDASFEIGPATEFELPVARPEQVKVTGALTSIGRRLLDFATSNDRQQPASQFWAWFGIAGTAVPVLVAAML